MDNERDATVIEDEIQDASKPLEQCVREAMEVVPAKVRDHLDSPLRAAEKTEESVKDWTPPKLLREPPLTPAARRQAMLEFREWKRTLMEMIRTQSQLVFAPGGQYQFVLPSKLVKLVWTTTIRERVKVEQLKQAEDAELRALTGVREELDKAVKALSGLLDAEPESGNDAAPTAQAAKPEEGQDDR